MHRRLFLLVATLLAACPLASVRAADAAKRPNILWVVSEDNSPFLGCYGCQDAHTPHLDKLATEGIRYTNACANAPVCAPTRCTIITGVYAPSMGTQHMRSRYAIPTDTIKLFPYYLRQAGYFCTNNSKTDYNLSPVQKDAWDMISKGEYSKRKEGQPFFAIYNLGTSHESSLHKPLDKSLMNADVAIPPYHPDTPEIRANWAMYHQIITRMDSQVGDILKKLEDAGLADDTIVFYYSDHGGIVTRSKRYLFDTGVHVPMIVRFGKNFQHLAPQGAGTTCDRNVSFVDLAPTLLSLAGVDIPDYMQGHAFLGPKKTADPDYNFCFRGRMDERYDMMRSVRDGQFNYIRNYNPQKIYGQHLNYLWKMATTNSWEQAYQAGKCKGPQKFFWEPKPSEELYDHTKDPWEVHNLADDPKFADVLARMRKANRQHLLETRDSGFLPEAEMLRRAGGDTVYEMVRDESRYPLERIMDAAELASDRQPEHLPQLVKLLADKDPAVRYWGATGCIVLGKEAKSATPQLMEALKDENPNVRIAAAEALCGLDHGADALPVLKEACSQPGAPYALHAVNVFEVIDDSLSRQALDVLQKCTKDKSYVGRASSWTVERLAKK